MSSETSTNVLMADYHNPSHAKAIGFLMNHYARDPFGGGTALPGDITETIAHELSKRDYAFSLLCFVDGEPVALMNCFELFSTFACKPLINIHDIVVLDGFRGRGLSHALLSACEKIARERGCCKLTLEVLSKNDVAKSSYQKFGFGAYQLDDGQLDPEQSLPREQSECIGYGIALFWQKSL